MKRSTVEINCTTLSMWLEKAWKEVWGDVSTGVVTQDFVTATDLVAAIRVYADDQTRSSSPSHDARWWGYNSFNRLVIVDKPGGYDLLGLVRQWLQFRTNDGFLEGHNFGRGHCSGMRYRLAGTGLSDSEKKTIADKEKPRAMHYTDPKTKEFPSRAFCVAARKSRGFRSSRTRTRTRTTTHVELVTCTRCKKKLALAKETGL